MLKKIFLKNKLRLKLKWPSRPHLIISALKNVQALYYEDANKILEKVAQEKTEKEI